MKQWILLLCLGNFLVLSFAWRNDAFDVEDNEEDLDYPDGGSLEEVDKHESFLNSNATKAVGLSGRRAISKYRGKQQMWKLIRREVREVKNMLPTLVGNLSWMDMDVKDMNKNYYTLVGDVRVIKAEVSLIKSLAYKLWKNVSDTVSDHPKMILALWWILNNVTEVGEGMEQTSKSMSDINESYSKVVRKLSNATHSISGFKNSIDGMSSEFDDIRQTLRSTHANTSSALDKALSLIQTIFFNYNVVAQNIVYLVNVHKDILEFITELSNETALTGEKIIFISNATQYITIEIRDMVRGLNNYLGAFEDRLSSLNRVITMITTLATTFDQRLSSMSGEITGMSTLITAFDQRLSSMSGEIVGISTFITTLDRRLTSLNVVNTTTSTLATTIEQYFPSLTGDITTMNTMITVIEQRLISLTEDVTTIDKWLTKFEQHLFSLNDRITAIEKHLGGYDKRFSSLDASVTTIQNNMHSLEQNLQDVRGSVVSIDQQVGAMGSNTSSINQRITIISNTVNDIDKKLIFVIKNITVSHSDVEQSNSRMHNLSARIDILTMSIDNIQDQCKNIDFIIPAIYATHDNVGRVGQHLNHVSEEMKIAMGILKEDLDTVKDKLRDIRNVMSVPPPRPRPNDTVTEKPLINLTTPPPWWLTTLFPYQGDSSGHWQPTTPPYRPPRPEIISGMDTSPHQGWQTPFPYPTVPHPPAQRPVDAMPGRPSDHSTTRPTWMPPESLMPTMTGRTWVPPQHFPPTMTAPAWFPTTNMPPSTDESLANEPNVMPPTMTLPPWIPTDSSSQHWPIGPEWWQTPRPSFNTHQTNPKPWWETGSNPQRPTLPPWLGSPLYTFTAPAAMPGWWPTPRPDPKPPADSITDNDHESHYEHGSSDINCNCNFIMSTEDKLQLESKNVTAFESLCPCENRLKDHFSTLFDKLESKFTAVLAKQEDMFRVMQMQLEESLTEQIHTVGYIVSFYATSILHAINNTRKRGGKILRKGRKHGTDQLPHMQRHLLDKFLLPPTNKFNDWDKQRIPGVAQSEEKTGESYRRTSKPKIIRRSMNQIEKQQDGMLPLDISSMRTTTEIIQLPVVELRMTPNQSKKVSNNKKKQEKRNRKKKKKKGNCVTFDKQSEIKVRSFPVNWQKNIGYPEVSVNHEDYNDLEQGAEEYALGMDGLMEESGSEESVPADNLGMIRAPLNPLAFHNLLQNHIKNQFISAIQPGPMYRAVGKRKLSGHLHGRSRNRHKLERTPMFSVMPRFPFVQSLPYPFSMPPLLPIPPVPLIPPIPQMPEVPPIPQMPLLPDFFASLPLSMDGPPYSFSYNDGKGSTWNVNMNRRSSHFGTSNLKKSVSKTLGREDTQNDEEVKKIDNESATEASQETDEEVVNEDLESKEANEINESMER